MKILTAAAIWLIVAFSIVTMWNPGRWAVGIPEMGVFTVAAVVAVACAAGWQRFTFSPTMVTMGALIAWGLMQLALGNSVYAWRTESAVVYWAANAAVFFAALQAFAEPGVRRWFLNALTVFATAIAIVGLFQSLDPAGRVFGIFTPDPKSIPQFGPFPYKNQYAAFVELVLPLAVYRAMTAQRMSVLWGAGVAVLYSSVIASSSRMGFFLATAEMLIVPVLVVWKRRIPFRQIRGAAFFFLAILTMLAAAAGPGILMQKFEAADPYAGRREYTEASIAMIRDRPLTGFGLGTWPSVYPGYAQFDDGLFVNQAHDDWAQWAAEGGLPFAAILLAIAVVALRRGLRTGWGLGVAAVFIHCTVDYPIQRIGVSLAMFEATPSCESTRLRSPFGASAGTVKLTW
jgi:O-antigen ligase